MNDEAKQRAEWLNARGAHPDWLITTKKEIEVLKAELSAFKKNNEELIQRHNAAISSWDEERERALREGNRVLEWRKKYEDLERENVALRADAERYRWIKRDNIGVHDVLELFMSYINCDLDKEIDQTRAKEGQP